VDAVTVDPKRVEIALKRFISNNRKQNPAKKTDKNTSVEILVFLNINNNFLWDDFLNAKYYFFSKQIVSKK
jgi:hypothetical protein